MKTKDMSEESIDAVPQTGEIVKQSNPNSRKTNTLSQAEMLISQAIDKNVPVETMEKLLSMRRELRAENAKEQYDKAMAKLQSDLPVVEKNKTAGSGGFAYNYAPLEYIIEKTKETITKNGFSYYFDTEEDGNFMTIFCHTTHSAGHSKSSHFKLPIDKSGRMNDTQKYGSALTYGKRYCFCNAFGIVVGGEDNDATTEKPEAKKTVIKQVELITAFQKEKVDKLLKDKNKTMDDVQRYCNKYFKKQYPVISLAEANQLINSLEKVEVNNKSEDVDPDEIIAGMEQQKLEEAQHAK